MLHVDQALRVSAARNLEMIAGSINTCEPKLVNPFYDAEHFFDGFVSDEEYALDTLRAAHEAGADRLILCDTNGGMLPSQIVDAVSRVADQLPNAVLGIHVHNDGGLAVANS